MKDEHRWRLQVASVSAAANVAGVDPRKNRIVNVATQFGGIAVDFHYLTNHGLLGFDASI
jgi:hypothetical protein